MQSLTSILSFRYTVLEDAFLTIGFFSPLVVIPAAMALVSYFSIKSLHTSSLSICSLDMWQGRNFMLLVGFIPYKKSFKNKKEGHPRPKPRMSRHDCHFSPPSLQGRCEAVFSRRVATVVISERWFFELVVYRIKRFCR